MDNELSDLVAARVRAERERRGWNRDRFAHELGAVGAPELTVAVIVNIETGRRQQGVRRRCITIDELAVFAQVFGLPIERFLHAPECSQCLDFPPPGFICQACGAKAALGVDVADPA